MFNGMPTRVVTAMVVCAQIAAMFLAITVPVPQSLAREGKVQLAASDVAMEQGCVGVSCDEGRGRAEISSDEAQGHAEVSPDEEWGCVGASFDELVGGGNGCSDGAAGDAGGEAVESELPFGVVEPAPHEASGSPRSAVEAGVSEPYDADDLRTQGVIYDGGYRYTWYSQRVLPGGGLEIDGRHVSDEGYVCDAGERIVVASSDLPRGTELAVPFGSGKAVVLDTGCASGTIDVYTDF